MIKTVIFDVGNVLMRFDWYGYVAGLYEKSTAERINQAIMGSGIWDELDYGCRLEEDIFQDMVNTDPEIEKEIRYTLAHDDAAMGKMEYAIPLLKEIKEKGYQVLFLSNYSNHVMKAKWEVLDFLPYMDGGVFSCEVHMVKPNADIYEALVEKYSLNKEECLFIDDREENVETARKLGMQGLLFKGYENSYSEIMERL